MREVFLKDIQKLNDKKIAQKLQVLFEAFEEAQNLQDTLNIKKLKGFNTVA